MLRSLVGSEMCIRDSLVAGSCEGKLYEYSLESGSTINVVSAHAARILCVGWLGPDCVLSASEDGSVKLWRRHSSSSATVCSTPAVWTTVLPGITASQMLSLIHI
eukprot:TRINITY_DN29982_c0_g1_i1.p1 TRINITY_DN29982_c0_g1~~TRINITY_DN29982_c0_g1_i1.p1  ORF type:complete len:105 (+),score=26.58 TRINITY_DN29982_c0_g1_i1:148-462(+)